MLSKAVTKIQQPADFARRDRIAAARAVGTAGGNREEGERPQCTRIASGAAG